MSNTKQLRNNTIALAIIQILNYILPFITLPYVARIFEVDKFGIIFFAQVFMDYFWRLIMFGFDLSGVREISINRENKEKCEHIFNSILNVQILFFIIGFLILMLITLIIPKFRVDWLIYHLTYVGLVGQILLFTWFYQGMERMKFITILNIITRFSFLILVFSCIKTSEDYILYPLFNSRSYLITGIVSLVFIKKYFNPLNTVAHIF